MDDMAEAANSPPIFSENILVVNFLHMFVTMLLSSKTSVAMDCDFNSEMDFGNSRRI